MRNWDLADQHKLLGVAVFESYFHTNKSVGLSAITEDRKPPAQSVNKAINAKPRKKSRMSPYHIDMGSYCITTAFESKLEKGLLKWCLMKKNVAIPLSLSVVDHKIVTQCRWNVRTDRSDPQTHIYTDANVFPSNVDLLDSGPTAARQILTLSVSSSESSSWMKTLSRRFNIVPDKSLFWLILQRTIVCS